MSTSLDEMNSWTQQQTVFLAQITEDISLSAYLALDPDGSQLNIEAVRGAHPSCGVNPNLLAVYKSAAITDKGAFVNYVIRPGRGFSNDKTGFKMSLNGFKRATLNPSFLTCHKIEQEKFRRANQILFKNGHVLYEYSLSLLRPPSHHLSNESFLQPTKRRAQPQPSVKQEQSEVKQWRWRTVPRNATFSSLWATSPDDDTCLTMSSSLSSCSRV